MSSPEQSGRGSQARGGWGTAAENREMCRRSACVRRDRGRGGEGVVVVVVGGGGGVACTKAA